LASIRKLFGLGKKSKVNTTNDTTAIMTLTTQGEKDKEREHQSNDKSEQSSPTITSTPNKKVQFALAVLGLLDEKTQREAEQSHECERQKKAWQERKKQQRLCGSSTNITINSRSYINGGNTKICDQKKQNVTSKTIIESIQTMQTSTSTQTQPQPQLQPQSQVQSQIQVQDEANQNVIQASSNKEQVSKPHHCQLPPKILIPKNQKEKKY